jgi:hypothetical protein
MKPRTLRDIEAAFRSSWSAETCDQVDVAHWSTTNPARGQCGATALTLNDLLGGELLVAEVLFLGGIRQGFHYWNLLSGGVEVDLTRGQFASIEVVQAPEVMVLPPGLPGRGSKQYLLLKDRVFAALADAA